jgi:tetratricopeptide (TPR) repeat protein
MRISKIGLAGLGLVFCTGAAVAGAEQDCKLLKDAAARVRACGEVIEGAGFGREQKAAAFRLRGRARAEAGSLNDALADLDQAVQLQPADASAFAARGQIHLSRKDDARAIADLSEAVRLDPENADYLVVRGHGHLVGGRPQDAISDFTAALALDPGRASALNNRGLAYRKAGDIDRAIADYTAAVAASPLYALAFNNRGYAYEAKGQKSEAIADFRRALLIDPSLAGARKGLARLGDTGGAAAESAAYARAGQQTVEKNCGWCHATGRTGTSPNAKAPEFRNIQKRHPLLALREPLSRGIAAPHDQMPRFDFSEREVDQIVAYINSLGHAETP